MKASSEKLIIPFQPNINMKEYINLQLSNILPSDMSKIHYRYKVIKGSIEVSLVPKPQKILVFRIMKIQDFAGIIFLVFLYLLNISILHSAQKSRVICSQHEVRQRNAAYHEAVILKKSRDIKSRNLKFVRRLNTILLLPLSINYLNIEPEYYELEGSIDSQDLAYFEKMLTLKGLDVQITKLPAKNNTQVYVRGVL